MKNIIAAAALLSLTACAGTPPLSSTLTDTDQERLSTAHFYAFNGTLSQQSVWANTATGNGGTVHALSEFQDADTGLMCRKIIEHIRSTDGQREDRTGTACQQPDGRVIVTFDSSATAAE